MSIEQLLAMADEALARGEEQAALDAYLSAARTARESFAPELEARACLGAGAVRHLMGDEPGARAAFHEAIARAMEGGSAMLEADAHFSLAMLAFDHGRSKDGHDALLESMALYREMSTDEGRTKMARAVRTYGEHIAVLGDAKAAREALELARAMYRDLGDDAAVEGLDDDLSQLKSLER